MTTNKPITNLKAGSAFGTAAAPRQHDPVAHPEPYINGLGYVRFEKAENHANQSTKGKYLTVKILDDNYNEKATLETKTLKERTEMLAKRNHPLAGAFETLQRMYLDKEHPDRHKKMDQKVKAAFGA